MLGVSPAPSLSSRFGAGTSTPGHRVLTTAWLLDLVAGCQLSKIPLPKSNLKERAEFQKKS